jgi:hypothetical protein
MTDVCRQIIVHPSAWTAAQLGGKSAITRQLSPEQIAGIDELLARTAHLAPQAVTRKDFDHPAVNELITEIRNELTEGRGLTLLSGLDATRLSPEQMERIYWGIGMHLGVPAVQSRNGDRLGRVQEEENDPVARGYRSSAELHMHTDAYEIVGLMCIQQAAKGGQSALVSSLALHNEILRTHPEHLAPLYEGYYMAIPEAQFSDKPITEQKIPVFCYVDGKVSSIYSGRFMHEAARKMNVPLPQPLADAHAHMAALAQRDDLALRFMLEPGEIVLWHNFMNLHSRTEFENDATHKRLLLRLWLKVPNGRPVVPEIYARGQTYDRVYEEAPQAQA